MPSAIVTGMHLHRRTAIWQVRWQVAVGAKAMTRNATASDQPVGGILESAQPDHGASSTTTTVERQAANVISAVRNAAGLRSDFEDQTEHKTISPSISANGS